MLNFLIHNYLTRGFWGDEAWTAGISRLPIKEIISITSQDFHPPFYYFIVHFVGGMFNFAETPVRLISTFFYLLVPLLTYFFVKLIWKSKKSSHSKIINLISSILVLFSPILFTYAFEARSYGLLAFECIASAFIFWQAKSELKGNHKWRILYFLIGGVMVYTHYYAWFVLASHAFYLLLFERKRIVPMLPAALGILAVQLPWLPTLFGQTSSVKGSYWIGPMNSTTHLEFLWRIGGGDLVSIFQKPLAYILSLTALVHFIYVIIKGRLTQSHKFLLTWLLVPTIIPTIISLVLFPVFFYRYLIFSAIPLTILFVNALRELPLKVTLLIVTIVAIMQITVDNKIFRQYPRSMRETVSELYQIKTPGDSPVFTVLPAFAEVLYYVGDQDQILVTPEGLIQFSGKSLLDAYVRLGIVKIVEPLEGRYFFLTPDKQVVIK